MSVTYTKNNKKFVVINPNDPIASDGWFDEILYESDGTTPQVDNEGNIKVQRHVIRTSGNQKNLITSEILNESINSGDIHTAIAAATSPLASVSDVNQKIDTTLLQYLSLQGGKLTGGVAESVAEPNDSASGTVALNANLKCIYPITAVGDITFTLSGSPGSEIIVSGKFLGNHLISYPEGVSFINGQFPELTKNGNDLLVFFTADGIHWIGIAITNLGVAA